MSEFAGQFIRVHNEKDLQDLIRACLVEGTPLVPTSNDTKPPLLAAETDHCTVSLATMNQVNDYAADDLTITVGVGAKLADIQRIVGTAGQRLTVEVPTPKKRAVGSTIGMGHQGFLGTTLGSLADQVLGIKAISGDGRRLAGGGRVVKNVTGYDFVRLLCGSAGGLGIVTEVTFRLRPKPPMEKTFVLTPGSLGRAERFAQELRSWSHVLTAIVVIDGTALHRDQPDPLLLIRGEGSTGSLKSLGQRLKTLDCPEEELDNDDSRRLWQEVRQFPSSQNFHLALRLPPSQVGRVHSHLTQNGKQKNWGFVADMQKSGISFTLNDDAPIEDRLEKLNVKVLEEQNHVSASLPDDLSDREGRWERFLHPDKGARKIGDRIKIAFDPGGILLPHRPVAGSF